MVMKEQIKQGILQLLRTDYKCLVPEIINYLERNDMPARGNEPLYIKENCLLWHVGTADFNSALLELIEDETLIVSPIADIQIPYQFGGYGHYPAFPIAKRTMKYKYIHWYPAELTLPRY